MKENALSISAIIVSLCAMFISFYQTNIMREQQYASVRPLVVVGNSMGNSDDSTAYSKILIWNRGIGPALIKYVDFEYKGKHYSEFQLQDFLHKVIAKVDSAKYINVTTSSATASAIAANDQIEMFILQNPKECYWFNTEYFRAANNGELSITVYFTDVYDRLFKTSLIGHKTVPATKQEIEKLIPIQLKQYIDL